MKIGVIGSGSFGCAICSLLERKGFDIALWSYNSEEAKKIERERENAFLLPGVKFGDKVHCTDDMESVVKDADLIVTVVPSFATRATARNLAKYMSDGQQMVNLSKGIEGKTLLRLSQVYEQELPNAEIAVMSGPSHAEEIGKGIPTTCVVSAKSQKLTSFVQDIFMSDNFRVYRSEDIIGVEIGAALKNVIALCAGISDGLGYGDNTKAALMTRGIAEIKRLGIKMGAKAETFAGLSGVGDLIVTCTSMHSRNRRCGILLGQGMKLEEAEKEIHMVVEGVHTAKAAYELSLRYEVNMPIAEQAYRILFEGKDPRQAVLELMTRDKTAE